MNYQIVADESVDFRIVSELRKIGFFVYSIAEELPSITDKAVLFVAFDKKALLITEDKDFGELVFRLKLLHHGILLMRVEEKEYKIIAIASTIKQHYNELLNKFSVINNNKLRIIE